MSMISCPFQGRMLLQASATLFSHGVSHESTHPAVFPEPTKKPFFFFLSHSFKWLHHFVLSLTQIPEAEKSERV
jgi:hypothetical protein